MNIRRRDYNRCDCGPDLPGRCPGRAACPYSDYEEPEPVKPTLEHMHAEPIRIEVGEELTTCLYCGTRTDTVGERTDDGLLVEFCGHCGQNYIIEEEAPE